ncbi:MAG: hypothetical protein Q7J44_03620 [Pseudotabrizicola sp.]|uniref:hypothetical protein n=1 Tax=Pseudotabrizicola sp. TaxID=2939647 RepID=UPI00271F0E1B|nr:hypothetical protein [Pseudotabrizicola sp.]MDO9637611.1 hypothetical protein [Pseudotabrizicola sp.]
MTTEEKRQDLIRQQQAAIARAERRIATQQTQGGGGGIDYDALAEKALAARKAQPAGTAVNPFAEFAPKPNPFAKFAPESPISGQSMNPEQIAARARARRRLAEQQAQAQALEGPSVSSVAGNFGAGTQTGIAQMAGFPVDAVTGAINGVGEMTGMWGPIESPLGGSASIDAALQPFRANIPEPQNTTERMARRVGEEVGASVVAAPVAMGSAAVRAAPGLFAGTEAASAIGSGAGAAIANEIAPGSTTAEIVGLLAGGVPAGYAAGRALGANGSDAVVRGGIEDQRMMAADAYAPVRADTRVLPQDSVDNFALGISNRMSAERINSRLQPSSSAVLDAIVADTANPMRIEDIENLRRLTESSIPGTAAPADRRLAGIMKSEITDYLNNLNDPIADSLREGRDAHRRATAAQSIDDASTKAVRRAASTGSGGNEINAMRQNLRSILDNPRKARSFKPEELALMEQVVRGTGGQNALRSLSRLAPTSGGLSAMLGVGGVMASPAVALPIMAITELAKAGGERSTRRVVDALMQSIAPDRVLKTGETGINSVVRALLAGRAIAGGE